MRVDIEKVRWIMDERRKINILALNDIEWYEDGKKVDIPKETVDDFSSIGLNNIDFIGSGYYLKKFIEKEN